MFWLPPNTEPVLGVLPNAPRLLPKLGFPPNTGFVTLFVLPNTDVLLGEAKPPPKGVLCVPNVLLPNTLEAEVLLGSPSWGAAKEKFDDFPATFSAVSNLAF